MFNLRRIKVGGFRGFRASQEFDLGSPVVLLFGESRAGKSSTLNAVEWCLFGDDSAKVGAIGIRERIDWRILNDSENQAYVEIEFHSEEGSFVITRQLTRSGRRLSETLTIKLPNGTSLEGNAARDQLRRSVPLSVRDFMTVVYQHQENVRDIIVQEPRTRNDAIDRLLGLSDYRAILKGIRDSKLSERHQGVTSELDKLRSEIETALRLRQGDLHAKREEAHRAGITENDLSEDAGLRLAEKIRVQVASFAEDLGLEKPVLESPHDWKDFGVFQATVGNKVNELWSSSPSVKEQQSLIEEQQRLTILKTRYDTLKQSCDQELARLQTFITTHGDESALDAAIQKLKDDIQAKQDERREVNSRAGVVKEAMTLLEGTVPPQERNRCPVCGTEVSDLLDHLKYEWSATFEGQIGEIQRELDELQSQMPELNHRTQELQSIRAGVRNAEESLVGRRNEIAQALSTTITEQDDPSSLIGRKLENIAVRLKDLEQAIRERRATLEEIQKLLDNLKLIEEVLSLEQKVAQIEGIRQTDEFRRLEGLRDSAAEIVSDVNEILERVREAALEEGKEKIAIAQGAIDVYFRTITESPNITKLSVTAEPDPRATTSYEFKDQEGNDVIPILNQGDMNSLALSIFLGLANTAAGANPFQFLLFDDPSQSLGSHHKKRFAEVLNEIAQSKQLVIATMDNELQGFLTDGLTKVKTVYRFSDWTPGSGPRFEKL